MKLTGIVKLSLADAGAIQVIEATYLCKKLSVDKVKDTKMQDGVIINQQPKKTSTTIYYRYRPTSLLGKRKAAESTGINKQVGRPATSLLRAGRLFTFSFDHLLSCHPDRRGCYRRKRTADCRLPPHLLNILLNFSSSVISGGVSVSLLLYFTWKKSTFCVADISQE